jgi:hypothetical protein
MATIWRFFLASVVASCTTALIVRSMPHLEVTFGAPVALVRILTISSVYFSLYVGSVIALHGGMKPINDTVGLLRDLLPHRMPSDTTPRMVDVDEARPTPAWRSGTS